MRDGELSLPFGRVHAVLANLKGRVLTTADASIPAGPQNKAVKDVIRMIFDECYRTMLQDIPLPEGQSWATDATLEGSPIIFP